MLSRWLHRSYGQTRGAIDALLGKSAAGEPRRSPSPPEAATVRTMRVCKVEREAEDAVILHLEDLEGHPQSYLPGQFVIVTFPIGGRPIQRAYSLCVPPGGPTTAIAVKRQPGGTLSPILCEQVHQGDRLRIDGPYGRFTYPPSPPTGGDLVFFAGGSGITPIMSILESVLRNETDRRARLLYGNRNQDAIMFRSRLDALADTNSSRFTVTYVVDSPSPGWTGGAGRVDAAAAGRFVESLGLGHEAHYYICGPEGMIGEVRRALDHRRVPEPRIHVEHFKVPRVEKPEGPTGRACRTVTVRRQGTLEAFEVDGESTILEAGLAAGVRLPFSCTLGGCGACRVRLASGSVSMGEPNCLSEQEKQEGYVLACVARPTGPCVLEVLEHTSSNGRAAAREMAPLLRASK